MKICYYSRAIIDLLPYIHNEFVDRKYNDLIEVYVAQNNKEGKEIIKHIDKTDNIFLIDKYFEENWNDFTLEKLKMYESFYECRPIWKYINMDRFLIRRSHEYCIKIVTGYFMFYDELFNKYKFDCYIDEPIALISSIIAYFVSKKHGAIYTSNFIAKTYPETHSYFIHDLFQNNYSINHITSPSIQYMEEAKQYLNNIRTDFHEPSYMQGQDKKPKFHLNFLLAPVKMAIWILGKECNNKYDYISYKKYLFQVNPLYDVKNYFNFHKIKKYFKNVDLNDNTKFVYFPLHYQPEANTIVCANKYVKQDIFIDAWSKSLPSDVKLYVKEHTTFLGHKSKEFYKTISSYPNVVLVSPWVSSIELTKKAIAVTTLTGTAGWEAMLLQKPVFLGGNVFYADAPGVIKITDMYNSFLENFLNWEKPSENEVINYLAKYLESIKACKYFELCKNESDFKKTSSFFVDEIQRLCHSI